MPKHGFLLLALSLSWPIGPCIYAQAETNAVTVSDAPTENITVTATRHATDQIIHEFVKSYAAPSPALNKLARWRNPICPATVGLPKKYGAFVTERVKTIAQMVGAPVNPKTSCRINIDIVFTKSPQSLLDKIRKQHPIYLGWHDTSQTQAIATVKYPIQGWYLTQTEDLDGIQNIDYEQKNRGVEMFVPPGHPTCPTGCWITYPNAREEHVESSRLTDRLRSNFYHVMIVADPSKLIGFEMGAIANYIAMIALTQPRSFDSCENLPSISNLTSSNCDTDLKPNALTQYDVAFLKGVYGMDPSDSLLEQRGSISYQMQKTLNEEQTGEHQ